jgi:hypothetical protein
LSGLYAAGHGLDRPANIPRSPIPDPKILKFSIPQIPKF